MIHFIAQSNHDEAEGLVRRMVEYGDGLAKFPEMGRTVPELPGAGVREIIEERYRIVCRIQTKGIQIASCSKVVASSRRGMWASS